MARKVFFSFHFERDAWRVGVVRNVNALNAVEKPPFLDAAKWEKVRRQGDPAIKRWIDTNMNGSSVTVVLIGLETANRKWVKYEIQKSIDEGKGLFGIDISKIRNQNGETDATGTNPLPSRYPLHLWNNENGRENIGAWIEEAARNAGR